MALSSLSTKARNSFVSSGIAGLQCSSDICELRICVLYACILHIRVCLYTHIRAYMSLFVMHSHKFLYMKHCWSNKRPVIFFANSPTNLLDLKLPKMGTKLKQSLEVPISTCELYVLTRKVLCFSTCRQVVCKMFIV